MTKELEELSETLLIIYQKNLEFLRENFFDIYEKIEELSNNINHNIVEEKYTLEFIDGYFDILNHENNGLYYHTNSYEDAEQRSEKIDFSTSSSFDLLRRNPNTGKLLSSELYKDVMPIVDYINDNVDLEDIEYLKIYKFIFISTGLGFHIQEINKTINPFTTLIIEPELEIFRLSLFVTDYTIFEEGEKKLFLSIGSDKIERQKVLESFNTYHEYMNYSIKHYSLIEANHYIRDEIRYFFGRNSVVYFPYKLVVQNLERTISFMKEGHNFLSTILAAKEKIFEDKKILVISAGPSIDNYINYIKENQDKFLILCVDVIVRKLEKHNIVPDVVVSIDPAELCADFLTTEDPNYLNNSSIILLSQQHPRVLEVLKDKKYYFSQVIPLIENIGYFGSVPNVGTFSFDMAVMLGGKEIYLVGNDAAFNQETGTRYSSDSSNFIQDSLKKDTDKNTFSSDDVVEVKGNLREKIKSNNELLTFRSDFESAVRAKENIFEYSAYNLSDGAYIEGFEPMPFDEFNKKVETFEKEKEKIIHDMFEKISNPIEKLNYEEEIKIFVSILNRAKKFQKKTFKSKNDFLENKLELMIWVLEKTKGKSNNVFANIFLRYTALVDIYINFLLNLKQDNLHKKDEINKISNMWAKGLHSLFKDMKNAVSNIEK